LQFSNVAFYPNKKRGSGGPELESEKFERMCRTFLQTVLFLSREYDMPRHLSSLSVPQFGPVVPEGKSPPLPLLYIYAGSSLVIHCQKRVRLLSSAPNNGKDIKRQADDTTGSFTLVDVLIPRARGPEASCSVSHDNRRSITLETTSADSSGDIVVSIDEGRKGLGTYAFAVCVLVQPATSDLPLVVEVEELISLLEISQNVRGQRALFKKSQLFSSSKIADIDEVSLDWKEYLRQRAARQKSTAT